LEQDNLNFLEVKNGLQTKLNNLGKNNNGKVKKINELKKQLDLVKTKLNSQQDKKKKINELRKQTNLTSDEILKLAKERKNDPDRRNSRRDSSLASIKSMEVNKRDSMRRMSMGLGTRSQPMGGLDHRGSL